MRVRVTTPNVLKALRKRDPERQALQFRAFANPCTASSWLHAGRTQQQNTPKSG